VWCFKVLEYSGYSCGLPGSALKIIRWRENGKGKFVCKEMVKKGVCKDTLKSGVKPSIRSKALKRLAAITLKSYVAVIPLKRQGFGYIWMGEVQE